MIARNTICLLVFMFAMLPAFGQYKNEFGYWESGFWKKFIKTAEDNNKIIEVHYRNGNILYSGEIKNGLPAGVWKYFSPKGELIRESDYNGIFRQYDHAGASIIRGQFFEGVPVGFWHYQNRMFYGCDSLYTTMVLDLDVDWATYYHYVYDTTRNVGNCPIEREILADSTVRSNSARETFESIFSHTLQQSFDIGVGKHNQDIRALNKFFLDRFGKEFSNTGNNYSLGLSIGLPDSWMYQFDFSGSTGSSLTTDASRYTLTRGQAFSMRLGYDVLRGKELSVMPYYGFSMKSVKLKYEILDDEHSENELINDINSLEYFVSDEQIDEVKFKSNFNSIDLGVQVRYNIPLGKYHFRGIYIGASGGYMLNVSSQSWTYKTFGDSKRQGDADFLPKINTGGFYWMVNLGLFTFYG